VASALNGGLGDDSASSFSGNDKARDPTAIDLNELLQVSPQASFAVIRAAYRALARDYHPDVNATPEAASTMGRLNAAYAVLSDPVRRARYHAYYARASRTARAPRGSGGRSTPTWASSPNRTSSKHEASPSSTTAARSHDRTGALQVVWRIVIVAGIAAVVLILLLSTWLVFSDTDDRSPPMFGMRGGSSTGAPIVAPGTHAQRPCGIGRVDFLSC
jgi:hypothetical protein